MFKLGQFGHSDSFVIDGLMILPANAISVHASTSVFLPISMCVRAPVTSVRHLGAAPALSPVHAIVV